MMITKTYRRLFALSAFALTSAVFAGPQVEFKTNVGNFTVELNSEKAPKTVANFLEYVKKDHYKGTIFHRVIPGFMVQGGGMDTQMHEKPTNPPIEIESKNGLNNDIGTIAMARTSDPNSATSQFFVNVNNNKFLNYPGQDGYGYTVFGKVVKGIETIKKMEQAKTTTVGMHGDVPAQPIVIESATLLKDK